MFPFVKYDCLFHKYELNGIHNGSESKYRSSNKQKKSPHVNLEITVMEFGGGLKFWQLTELWLDKLEMHF